MHIGDYYPTLLPLRTQFQSPLSISKRGVCARWRSSMNISSDHPSVFRWRKREAQIAWTRRLPLSLPPPSGGEYFAAKTTSDFKTTTTFPAFSKDCWCSEKYARVFLPDVYCIRYTVYPGLATALLRLKEDMKQKKKNFQAPIWALLAQGLVGRSSTERADFLSVGSNRRRLYLFSDRITSEIRRKEGYTG